MNRFSRQTNIVRFISTKDLLVFLAISLAVLTVSYGYLVQNAVRNALLSEKIQNKISIIGSTIGELEADYIKQKQLITPDLAYSLGFKDVTSEKFITRPKVGVGVSYNNEI